MTNVSWQNLMDERFGSAAPVVPAAPPAGVARAVDKLVLGDETPGQMLLRLEVAAAGRGEKAQPVGDLLGFDHRQRQTAASAAQGVRQKAPSRQGGSSTARSGSRGPTRVSGKVAALTVVPFILATVGPLLASERGRASSVGFPLEVAAVIAPVVALIGAIPVLVWELRREPTLGSRTRMSSPYALVVPVIASIYGIIMLAMRVTSDPSAGAAPFIGLAGVALAGALSVVATVVAVRSRRQDDAAAGPDSRMPNRPEVGRAPSAEQLDDILAERLRETVRGQDDRPAVRGAVLAGAEQLYRREALDERGARWLLRAIGD